MWSNKYLNIPFKEGGRDLDGLDCWGLARLVYKEEFGIELPSFAGEYDVNDPKLLHEIIIQHKESWEKLTKPEPNCIVLFRMLGTESHIGVVISPTQFLHTRDKYTSAVENLASTEWKNRIVGYFKYRENTGVVMQTIPHPLRTQRVGVVIPPGTNLQEVYAMVNTEYSISDKIKKNTHIILNGRVIPETEWLTTKLEQGDSIEYRAVPRGNNPLRSILTLALVITVMVVAPQVAALAGTQGSFAYAAAYVATAGAITMVGGALINAIAPIRPPDEKNLPDGTTISQTLINGSSNTLGRYSSIPVILGKMRVTPPLGAQNYARLSGTPNAEGIVENASISYLDMLLVWGYGPLYIDKSTMRIGKIPITDFYGDGPNGEVRYITLDRIAEPTTTQLTYFNSIYGKDIQQVSSGLNLTGNSITIGPNTPLNQLPANTVLLDPNSDPTGAKATEYRAMGKNVAFYGSTIQGLPPSRTHPEFVPGGSLFQMTPVADWIPSTTPGPWTTLALTQPCDKFTVALHFPQGLRVTLLKGESAGNLYSAPVVIDFEIKINNGNWTHWTTQTIGGTLNGDKAVTTTYVETGFSEDSLVEHTVTLTTQGYLITGGGYIKDAFTWTITKQRNWDPNAIIQVRVRRVTGDYEQPNDTWRYTHTVQLLHLTGFSNKTPAIDPPNSKIAKTALTIQATSQLNGRIEGVNAIAQTYCKVWDGTTWDNYAATSNPAALFLYVLTHPGNPQRVTDLDITDKVDFNKLGYWYDYCDQLREITLNGVNYTYKFEYNDILGSQKSVLDVLRDICAAGRASPSLVDGKWSVSIDEPKPIIVQHFSPHNSWGFESTKGMPRLPDALKIQYVDETAEYITSELIVSYADKDVDTAELFESIQLPGVTNIGAVADHARWHLAQVKVRPEIYTLNCDIEHIVCNRGDRVKVAHDVPMWGLGSGRIKTRVSDSIFKLDEDLEIKYGLSYILRIRSSTGTSSNIPANIKTTFTTNSISRSNNVLTVQFSSAHPIQVGNMVKVAIPGTNGVNINSVTVTEVGANYIKFSNIGSNLTNTVATGLISLQDGYYSTIQLSKSYDISEIDQGNLFLFGQNDQQFQDLIVLSIEPAANKCARLTLVDYGVNDQYDLFADYRTFTSDTVFKSNITVPPALLLNSIGDKKPIVDATKIISDTTAMEQIGNGVYRYTIKVPFVNMSDLPATVESVQAEVKLSDSNESAGTTLFTAPVLSNSITINNIEVNKQYNIRLRYISKTGNVGQWTDVITHTVLGKNANYQTITSIGIAKSKRNLIITPISDSIHSDFKCYEIRIWKNEGIGDFWTSTDSKIQKFTTTNSISVDLRNFDTPRISHSGVQYRVACRAVDTSGNYSPTSAINTITLKTMYP
jgi:hypothetical protein